MMNAQELTFGYYDAPEPIGRIHYCLQDDALAWLDFAENQSRQSQLLQRYYGDHKLVPAENPQGFGDRLKAYFSGDFQAFDGVHLALVGGEFYRQVWAALQKLRPGQSASYSDIALRLDNPQAVRAVGQANANNPFALVVPCHRVVAKDGGLHGYAGGLARKDWLLKHESTSGCPPLAEV